MTPRAESANLLSTALAFIGAGRPFAVATVLKADGSTPVEAGAKAVIEADGTIHGTVGGGATEAEAQRRAKAAIRSGGSSRPESPGDSRSKSISKTRLPSRARR